MNESDMTFIYQDARGNITSRCVSNISENAAYLQGYCNTTKALKTFRKDRILEVLNSNENIETKINHYISKSPPPKPPPRSHHLLDICFTGFKSDDKKRLITMAENNGVTVRSSVTKNLNFLCCGYNAGPMKINAARDQGVITLSEDQFIKLLETGEIPEN
jgi:NAD-dependent DNA ligase